MAKRRQRGYIYLGKDLSEVGLVKIGKTNNPERRQSEIRNMNPTFHMVLVQEFQDMHSAERYFHDRYAKKRFDWEWFALSVKDVKEIYEMFTGEPCKHVMKVAADLGVINPENGRKYV